MAIEVIEAKFEGSDPPSMPDSESPPFSAACAFLSFLKTWASIHMSKLQSTIH